MPSFLTKDGVSLAYKDWGTGRPVVLLSSWILNSDMWEFQFQALLGAGYRCIALDRRGHGRSDQPDGGYDLDTLASDVDALFQHLGLTDAIIVGQSMGGAEAVRYLSLFGSERVKGLITIGATLPFMAKTDDHPLGVDTDLLQGSLDALGRDRFAWIGLGLPGFFGETVKVDQSKIDWIVSMTRDCCYRAMIECQRTGSFSDLREDLGKVTIPSLGLVGSCDQSTSVALNEEAVGLLPNGRLKVYEGAAHAMYITHAEPLNQDLLEFIEGV